MKKLIMCIVTASLLLTLNPVQSVAATKAAPTSVPATNADAEKVKLMETRLNEINAMDKSKLSSSEKRVLRKEVRVIKKDIQRAGGGVYLSVGALLLIIILLIVLL
jgi:hypothetical protein